jgi:hypothetical protein
VWWLAQARTAAPRSRGVSQGELKGTNENAPGLGRGALLAMMTISPI